MPKVEIFIERSKAYGCLVTTHFNQILANKTLFFTEDWTEDFQFIRSNIDPNSEDGYIVLGLTRDEAYQILTENPHREQVQDILQSNVTGALQSASFTQYLKEQGLANQELLTAWQDISKHFRVC